ncbi:PepSY domain-containing protein [uncultured Clostridium sp.]|uniref:PepSY domain-containing protein n=1 Tax=uncultured Clostridium sp. TaxID=59620 RepID=UPI0025F1B43C|nr:PepSY domain-containing protein [uncultured Clostridium sp.]
MENIYKNLNIDKKKIKNTVIKFLSAGILISGIGAAGYFMYVKSNINYTEVQAEEIALTVINGGIIKKEKEIDDGILEYKYKIITPDNLIYKVTVSAKTGTVIDID